MRGIDQHLDTLVAKVASEPLGAAEAANSNRHRMRRRLRCAAGQRQGHRDGEPIGQGGGKRPRLGGAAKNEDAHGPR